MRILICADSLGYGGAETHIVGLARGLYEMGHSVTLASPPGELKRALPRGVEFIEVPTYGRKPWMLARSKRALRKIIKRGDFNIVHAHARIPAFLAAPLAKRYGAGFVVTAHAKFFMSPLLSRLSNWGELTVAVSEDIKEHLIQSCRIYPERIRVIPNGIDTERYRPDETARGSGKRIVFVSRLDRDCSLCAELLCRLAGRLNRKYPGIGITIVGGGNAAGRIRDLSEVMNTACGRDVIECVGARGDVEKVLAASDIFVGVSRAALEAAACGLPLIIAGNEGYGGVFDPNAPDESSNLCGRGKPMPDAELLMGDICRLLDMSEDERRALGDAGREYVCLHHSERNCVSETVGFYRDAIRRHEESDKSAARSMVVCGYSGFGNLGDDAMLDALIDGVSRSSRKVGITVLTRKGRSDSGRFGVRCVRRTNLFAILSALINADTLILGGGTLLQNATSPRSLSYYLAVARLGMLCGCRVVLYSAGLGPIYGERARKRVGKLLRRVPRIGLREPAAVDTVRSLGIRTAHAEVFADAALLTEPASDGRIDMLLSKYVGRAGEDKKRRYIAVSLRDVNSSRADLRHDQHRQARFAAAIDGICDICNAEPLFLLFSPEDRQISELIRRKTEHRGTVIGGLTPGEAVGIMSRCLVAVGMRLHMLIFAFAAGCPAVGIGCDPKINAFLSYAGLPEAIPTDLPSPGKLISLASLEASEREANAPQNMNRLSEMKELARGEIRGIYS